MFDTIPTTASFATILSIDLFTPALSSTTSFVNVVTPEPATVVGPISVHAEPLYTYSCVLVVSNHKSPCTALVGAEIEFAVDPTGLNFDPV